MATKKITTHHLGFPRIGEKRELKKATEAYWRGSISAEELEETGRQLRQEQWRRQQAAGIDIIPSNDFSFYDQMLDMSCLVGAIPPRFPWQGGEVDLDLRFFMARGVASGSSKKEGAEEKVAGPLAVACEMTKWFDTNYHYLVPEFSPETKFRLSSNKVFDEFEEAKAIGIVTKPVLIGPMTYLKLGKSPEHPEFDRYELLEDLIQVYIAVLQKLEEQGAEWVQLDEPLFSLDLSLREKELLTAAYQRLSEAAPRLKLLVANYFGALGDHLETFVSLPVAAIHIDGVRGVQELARVAEHLPEGKKLSLGMIDGRNIWKTDLALALSRVEPLVEKLGAERLLLAPSCSLIHCPVTLRQEKKLDSSIKSWLAFAEEKLKEVSLLAQALEGDVSSSLWEENRKAIEARRHDPRLKRTEVQQRLAGIAPQDKQRQHPFSERKKAQHKELGLPSYPTTTIGSFPQTSEIRAARAQYQKGDLSQEGYDALLREQIRQAIEHQEIIGLDLLVHGECERNDMVEYFGQQLDGFVFTEHGWVQSYGSRYVKPPLIFGDVSRPKAMTVEWSSYAQSLTDKPVKGMLTGPVTMLQWSFVRDDQPRKITAEQIALALRDEVLDLEKAGIRAIQIDEPALREGLPLRESEWAAYLDWAVEAFRLCASGVQDSTQIHTHMCYAEFNDIIEAVAALDADVISMEASRSNMELLEAFVHFRYPNEIGPGVYDIHSPRIPSTEEMVALLSKVEEVLPAENLWVNPDCGLKTRRWEEVLPALRHMVEAAQQLRERCQAKSMAVGA